MRALGAIPPGVVDVAAAERELKRAVEARTREFFSHCSLDEIVLGVREALGTSIASDGDGRERSGLEAHAVKRMIACALDRGARERELTARAMEALRESGTLDA